MSREAEAKEPKSDRLYDKRTIDRSIKKGLITRKDFDKHVKALEDVSSKGVYGAPDGLQESASDEAAE
jgi:hypothetical protein